MAVVNTIKRAVARVFSDNMCIICGGEFEKDDEVVQLRCSDKHILHASCTEAMLAAG